MNQPDPFWTDLLAYIKAGRVIPVVGERAVTFGEDERPLYPTLAANLVKLLGLDAADVSPEPTLTDVACEWLVGGGKSSELYKQLYLACEGLENAKPKPGRALRALVSIPHFNLFLSATFDSLLARALEIERPGALPASCGFFPNKDADEKDLPARKRRLAGPTIYHLFGQKSLIEGEYVVWEQDVLDFICALHSTLSTGKDLDLLARDLSENALLVIGLNFSDLLVRLFLRVAKQSRLTDLAQTEILAEHTPGFAQRGKVLFFGGVLKHVHIREQDPVEFAVELAHRWHKAYPAAALVPPQVARNDGVPDGAIFLSYAREDEFIVRVLADALKVKGCVVWYDRERLKAGAYWPDELKQAIERHCSLFIAIVSETTERAPEGYWRRERAWAIARAPDFYPEEFYVPVWVPPVAPPFGREPEPVRSGVNAISLPAAESEGFTAFAERLRALQIRRCA